MYVLFNLCTAVFSPSKQRVRNMLFFSRFSGFCWSFCFPISSLLLVFSSLTIFTGVVFFRFLLGYTELQHFFTKLVKCLAILSLSTLFLLLSLFFSPGSPITCALVQVVLFCKTLRLQSSLFNLFFRLDLNWSIFKFTNTFFCHLLSVVKSIQGFHLWCSSIVTSPFDFKIFIFRKRREGAREEEKHCCVRETSIGCLLHAPN